MNVDELLERIHAGPYWRILIQPSEFKEQRIETLAECKELIEDCRVILRGWDYPHIDTRSGGIDSGAGFVESVTDWEGWHYELWRFYKSGQFVHQFSSIERFHQLRRVPAPDRYILVHNTLFTVTEVFEFAARLARRNVFGTSALIGLELHGIGSYELTFDDSRGIFFDAHRAGQDIIAAETTAWAGELATQPAELALKQSIAIFEQFNWLDVDQRYLATEQAKFLERRLGVPA